MFVAGEHIVYKGRSAAPVSEDKNRVVLHGTVCQMLAVAAFLKSRAGGKQAADGLRQKVFCAFVGGYLLAGSECLKGFPVSTNQRIDG